MNLHLTPTLKRWSRPAAGLLLAIGLTLTGCASTGTKAADYKRLQQLEMDRQYAMAAYESEQVKKLPEPTADELENLADVLLSQGKLATAYINYEKALRLDPKRVAIHYKMGLTLLLANRNPDAVAEFETMLKQKPDHALSLQGLGQAYYQMNDYGKAARYFNQALAHDRSLWQSHNYLGIIYDGDKEYDRAIGEYSQAILINPENGLLYNNLGTSFLLTQQYEKAIRGFEQALRTGYQSEKLYNNLGLALASSGSYLQALEAFKKGGSLASAYNNLGCVYLSQNKFQQAIDCFERAVELEPGYYAQAAENLKRARLAAKQ
jgi:tetratricopeptide (TPR) repeat protein